MAGTLDESHPRPRQVRPRTADELTTKWPVLVWASAPAPAVTIAGVAQSSRTVRSGDVYFAIPGTRFHGVDFAADAAAAGAVLIITEPGGVERAIATGLPVLVTDDPRALAGEVAAYIYGYPSRQLQVVGITGTNGKTTTTYLLDAALRAGGHTTAVIGTVETRIADAHLPSAFTTPEAADLQALLAVALERGVDTVVLEVSSFALQLARVNGIQFAVGAFTNLSPDHLDVHRDMEEYFTAKAKLFDGRANHELIVVDDAAGQRLATMRPHALTVSGSGEHADWRADAIERRGYAQRFEALSPEGVKYGAGVGMPGRFNVTNALLAIAIAANLGVEATTAADAVADAAGVPGRMERVSSPAATIAAVVDYAHAPDGVAKALAALRVATAGRLICVLGAGGDRDVGKRSLMGRAAASGADIVIVTDDNPRSEEPAAIRAAVRRGAQAVVAVERAQVEEVGDRAAAIARAVALAEPGDTIAVLGKGHERGQIVAGVKHPFDDREILAHALRIAGK